MLRKPTKLEQVYWMTNEVDVPKDLDQFIFASQADRRGAVQVGGL